MLRKHRRVLWLLNHKALMPYEARLIIDLGFELFTPKRIPKENFRSGAISFDYDGSLSIPKKALERLNQFDFYLSEWPTDIVNLVNRYFGIIFVIPYGTQVAEAISKFDGQIVFRAFGLSNEWTYTEVLSQMYGRSILRKLEHVQDRLWFGEGYDHLHECEARLLQERSLFLPIGVPDALLKNAGKWTGTRKEILFVCPHAVTDSYYSGVYKDFKRDFGDLPHVIVGHQDVPVDDPHMAGFVSDEELQRLYLDCAALYYHSREIRHVHYSPVEAAINGMPIVYFADSLLGRMCPNAKLGRVDSVEQARTLLQRILAAEEPFVSRLREDQKDVAYHFLDAYCRPIWKENFSPLGVLEPSEMPSRRKIVGREIRRSLARLIGLKTDNVLALPIHSAAEAKRLNGSSLDDGVTFAESDLPTCIFETKGLSESEPWGRWSDAERIVISLSHLLDKEFILDIAAIGYGMNAGADITVKIGGTSEIARFGPSLENVRSASLRFKTRKLTNAIEILVPHPTQPPNDSRKVGVGLVYLKTRPIVSKNEGSAAGDGMRDRSSGSPRDTGKTPECKNFIEAGILASAKEAADGPTGSSNRSGPLSEIALPSASALATGDDPVPEQIRRPAWRSAVKAAIRPLTPVLRRLEWRMQAALEGSTKLGQVSADIAVLRHEMTSLRADFEAHVRSVERRAKVAPAVGEDLVAAVTALSQKIDRQEAAASRQSEMVERLLKGSRVLTDD